MRIYSRSTASTIASRLAGRKPRLPPPRPPWHLKISHTVYTKESYSPANCAEIFERPTPRSGLRTSEIRPTPFSAKFPPIFSRKMCAISPTTLQGHRNWRRLAAGSPALPSAGRAGLGRADPQLGSVSVSVRGPHTAGGKAALPPLLKIGLPSWLSMSAQCNGQMEREPTRLDLYTRPNFRSNSRAYRHVHATAFCYYLCWLSRAKCGAWAFRPRLFYRSRSIYTVQYFLTAAAYVPGEHWSCRPISVCFALQRLQSTLCVNSQCCFPRQQ